MNRVLNIKNNTVQHNFDKYQEDFQFNRAYIWLISMKQEIIFKFGMFTWVLSLV